MSRKLSYFWQARPWDVVFLLKFIFLKQFELSKAEKQRAEYPQNIGSISRHIPNEKTMNAIAVKICRWHLKENNTS